MNDAESIRDLSHGKLSLDDSEILFKAINGLLMIASDKSESRIKESIEFRCQDVALTPGEVDSIYKFILGYSYGEGDGTEGNPVVIMANGTMKGIEAEYAYLGQHYGVKGKDWKTFMRAQLPRGSRYLECFEIEMSDKSRQLIYFDITSFFGM